MKTKILILGILLMAVIVCGCVKQVEEVKEPELCRDETVECTTGGLPCCEGLVSVPYGMEQDGECLFEYCGDICRPCGNGVCDEGENRCNCPEDCE